MPATYEPIATTTLGSTAADITFSSIGSGYTDLRLVLYGRIVRAGASFSNPLIRLNGDTATNYSRTTLRGDGAFADSVRQTSVSYLQLGQEFPASTTASGIFGYLAVDFQSYAGSTNKTVLAESATNRNGVGWAYRTVGLWRSTSAITSIIIYPESGTGWEIGTTATLYGILKA